MNGNGAHPVTSQHPRSAAQIEVLEQRIGQQERASDAIFRQMAEDRDHYDRAFEAVNSKIDTTFEKIAGKLEQNRQINWQPYSLLGFALVTLGGVLYWPIKERQSEFQTRVATIEERIVPRSEHQERWRILERDLDNLVRAVERNADKIVPRGEHMEQWNSQRARDADLQRQIDEGRKAYGDTYSLKDALRNMQERLDRVEFNGRNGSK